MNLTGGGALTARSLMLSVIPCVLVLLVGCGDVSGSNPGGSDDYRQDMLIAGSDACKELKLTIQH